MVQDRRKMRDRFSKPHFDRAYKESRKLPAPTVCQDCGAIFENGRWAWGTASEGAHRSVRPACLRILGDDPAGYVKPSGDFLREHEKEITGLARNIETREMADHPFRRIMAVSLQDDCSLLIKTTDTHLAWSIGEAVDHAYHGHLQHRFAANSRVLHVDWTH